MFIPYMPGRIVPFGRRASNCPKVSSRLPGPWTGICGWDPQNTMTTIQYMHPGAGAHGIRLVRALWAIWLVIFWILPFAFYRLTIRRNSRQVFPKTGQVTESRLIVWMGFHLLPLSI